MTEEAVIGQLAQTGRYHILNTEHRARVLELRGKDPARPKTLREFVSILDADLVITGTAWYERAPAPRGFERLRGYEGTAKVRVFRSDSSEIVNAMIEGAMGRNFSQSRAIARVAQKISAAVSDGVQRSLAKTAARESRTVFVEVQVDEDWPSDRTIQLSRLMERIPGVENVTMRAHGTSLLVMQVGFTRTFEELTHAVTHLSIPLEVLEASTHSIRLRRPEPPKDPDRLSVEFQDVPSHLFFAWAARYRESPPGKVVIANHGRSSVRLDRVVFHIDEPGTLMGRSERSNRRRLKPGQRIEVPVTLELERAQATWPEAPRREASLRATVRFSDRRGGGRATGYTSVTLLPPHTLDWTVDGGRGSAAFVTPAAPTITAAAEVAAKESADASSVRTGTGTVEPIVAILALASGIELRRDPTYPAAPDALDDVRPPERTLREGKGDCDDLSVLLASLFEASGIRTVLIKTPGHVMLGAATDWPLDAAQFLPGAVMHDGVAFVALEATADRRSFFTAQKQAEERLRTSIGPRRIIDIRQGWREGYRPALKTPTNGTTAGRSEAWRGAVRTARARFIDEYETHLRRLRTVAAGPGEAPARYRAAVSLALWGDLESASATFQDLSSASSTDLAATNALGNISMLQGRAAEALRHYEAALQLEPRTEVRWNAVLAALVTQREPAARSKTDRRAHVHLKQLGLQARSSYRLLLAKLKDESGTTGQLSTTIAPQLRWLP